MTIDAKFMKRFHLFAIVFWCGMSIPTIFWWGQSVLWLNIMSLYAIIGTHQAGYQGARAERQGEKNG